MIDVGMGSTRTGGFDRVIPTIGLVQVGQGAAEAVDMPWARDSVTRGDYVAQASGRFRELVLACGPAQPTV